MHVANSVGLLLVVTFTIASVQGGNICDSCKCLTNNGVVKSVFCECYPQNKVGLNITQDKMNGLGHIETFSISNCLSVNFHQDSFAGSEDLQNVSISHVGQVTFPHGVFSALSSLLVENVGDLRLEKYAFMGAKDIQDITIHRSNISVLPSFSLFGVKGLQKIELREVIIDVIKTSAIDITMADKASFIINSSQVDTIEGNAVVLNTGALHIIDSEFEQISPRSVNVSASEVVEIQKTTFGIGCSNVGLAVQSNIINIVKNVFHMLPIGLLKKLEDSTSRITFTENDIYNFTLLNDGIELSTMLHLDNFKNNNVICDCDLARSVLTYKALQAVSTVHIVEQNYCLMESKCKISLNTLSQGQSEVCASNDTTIIETLCKSQPTSTPSTSTQIMSIEENTITTVNSERDPKSFPVQREYTTAVSTEPSTTSDNKHHMTAGMMSSGWTSRSNMILVAIIVGTASAKHILFN